MALEHRTNIALPAHRQPGGFDHAAVHRASARLYVAHTANDALDVIDCARDRYLHAIAGLTGVAGALVSDARPLVFTSNRGEHTVGIFAPDAEEALVKVPVGIGPNGLAYDPGRNLLLAANVGDPERPGSHTVSLVGVDRRALVAGVAVPGRTRWTVFERPIGPRSMSTRGRGGGEARRRACAGRKRLLYSEGVLALMGFVVERRHGYSLHPSLAERALGRTARDRGD